MKVLFLAHTEEDGSLGKAACEALTAAKGLSDGLAGELTVGLYGAEVQKAADQIAGCGAAKFFGVAGADFASARYGSDASACEAMAKAAGAEVIVMPATSRASRVAAGVGMRLGAAVDTRLTGLEVADGTIVATRWFYRQRMLGRIERDARPWLVTVDSGCFAACEAAGTAVVETLSVTPATRTTVTGVIAPAADAQTIRPDAKLLLVAGAGWGKTQSDGQKHLDDASSLILGLLAATQCSLGSSKSLVDQSGEGAALPFLTHMHQVGQTGATPRHAKGLATCCHGEEPHVVGWRFIGERRAVNLDANCGWAQGKADVLYVADAFAVTKKLAELLK